MKRDCKCTCAGVLCMSGSCRFHPAACFSKNTFQFMTYRFGDLLLCMHTFLTSFNLLLQFKAEHRTFSIPLKGIIEKHSHIAL